MKTAIHRQVVVLSLMLLVSGCIAPSEDARPTLTQELQPESEPWDLERAEKLLEERRYEEAAELYGRLRTDLAGSTDRQAQFRAINGWARARLTLGFHDEAKGTIPEMRSLALGDPRHESLTARFSAAVLHREGKLDQALSKAQEALARAREAQDPDLEILALGMMGTVHSLSGRNEEALDIDERLVALRRERDPGSRKLALQLNEVGIDYRNLGRYVNAVGVYEEALALYRAHDDIEGQAMVLYNLSAVQAATGQSDLALRNKLESLALAERVGTSYGLGLLNNDLGSTFLQAGNFARARQYLDRALVINRRSSQSYGETLALQSLGRLELDEHRPERARELLLQAMKLADENGHRREAATIRIALSRTAADEGQGGRGVELANDALSIAMNMQNPAVEFEALEAGAIAWESMGRLDDAAAASLRAIGLLESWRGRLALGDLRMGVADPRWDIYELAVRCLMGQGRIEEGFDVTERARARLLLELMAEREEGESVSGPERSRRRLRQRFAQWEKATGDRRAAMDSEIEALIHQADVQETSGRREPSPIAAARYPEPASLSEVRSHLITRGRSMISFFWGSQDVYGWWVDDTGVRGARLGRSDELRPLVEFLRAAAEDPVSPADWRGAARRAYDALVAPLSPKRTLELLVLADGPLSLVPLELLQNREDPSPWGALSQLIYGPSASVLLALARAAPRPEPPHSMLALGFSPQRFDATSSAPGETTRGSDFMPIPEAVSEARFVYELYRRDDAKLLIGREATLDAWLAAEPRDFRFLHFATHARVSNRRPLDSFLLLSHGGLTTADIRRTELSVDLVTLSACDTALGYRVRGEGIVGFSHAFLAAGARAVLVSLWRVDDGEAASFMRDFYTNVRDGHTPARALLATRKTRIESEGRASHPSAWAPFVLVGW